MTAEIAPRQTSREGLRLQGLSVSMLSKEQRAEMDALAAESPRAYPLQSPSFAALARAAVAESFTVLAYRNDELKGYWTGFFEHTHGRPQWVYQAMFRSGPVVKPAQEGEETDGIIRELIEAGEREAARRGAVRMIVCSEAVYGPCIEETMQRLGYRTDDRWATYVIDLARPLEDIWNGIDAKVRRSVKTAERRGVVVDVSEDIDHLRAFQSILDETLQAGEMPVQLARDYGERCLAVSRAGEGYVLIARHEGEVVGGKLDITKGGMAVSYNTAASRGNSRCGDLLAWREIEVAKQRGCAALDLLGVMLGDAGAKQDAIRGFKAKWGGALVETPVYTKELPVKGLKGVARGLIKGIRRFAPR